MKNYMVVNDKKIEISQETADNLKQKLGEKVTYSVGDRFMAEGNKCILVMGNYNEASMITLRSGMRHNSPITVGDIRKITKAELEKICSCHPIRYWDRQKKIKT